MENASKALLIAGGVLIALLVISLAMYMINQAQGTALSAEERRLQTITQEQTNKFAQYSGNIYGSEVENCIRRVYTYNKDKATSEKITVDLSRDKNDTFEESYDGSADEIVVTQADPTDPLKERIIMTSTDRNDIYKGNVIYRINGTIEKIQFKLQEKK